MDPNKGCSATLVAAEEGCYSIPITQRPSDQGRLSAEHELEATSSIRSLPPSSIAPSPKGFVHKIRQEKDNMKRKNPCAKEAKCDKGVHSPQPTFLTIHYEIRLHQRVCDDRLNGWLQCPAGDPVCQDQPARGHHTGFVCWGFPSPLGSCRREVRV